MTVDKTHNNRIKLHDYKQRKSLGILAVSIVIFIYTIISIVWFIVVILKRSEPVLAYKQIMMLCAAISYIGVIIAIALALFGIKNRSRLQMYGSSYAGYYLLGIYNHIKYCKLDSISLSSLQGN